MHSPNNPDYIIYCEMVLDKLPQPDKEWPTTSKIAHDILEANYLPFEATDAEFDTVSRLLEDAFRGN